MTLTWVQDQVDELLTSLERIAVALERITELPSTNRPKEAPVTEPTTEPVPKPEPLPVPDDDDDGGEDAR